MSKALLCKLALAAALTVAAILSTPHTASAANWCDLCFETGDCVQCCRCDGGGAGYCYVYCYGW